MHSYCFIKSNHQLGLGIEITSADTYVYYALPSAQKNPGFYTRTALFFVRSSEMRDLPLSSPLTYMIILAAAGHSQFILLAV